MKLRRRTKRALAGMSIVLCAVALLSVVVMLLWNALIPELFNGPILNYWQAAGILLLSHILLRGTPLYGMRGWRRARRMRSWKKRLASMSAEERAAFCGELGIRQIDSIQGS